MTGIALNLEIDKNLATVILDNKNLTKKDII